MTIEFAARRFDAAAICAPSRISGESVPHALAWEREPACAGADVYCALGAGDQTTPERPLIGMCPRRSINSRSRSSAGRSFADRPGTRRRAAATAAAPRVAVGSSTIRTSRQDLLSERDRPVLPAGAPSRCRLVLGQRRRHAFIGASPSISARLTAAPAGREPVEGVARRENWLAGLACSGSLTGGHKLLAPIAARHAARAGDIGTGR